ncbi:allantoin racemase [Angulomicrobium tetraedrale]|uniref:Allantoin racemase n=1 Tax=Ancylobacter tetraedralis TaxID=217068 RepID=A0A839ZFL7_9HYPH|nr:aspartate/glutamate racemase family protein [Ancylobacter tetraedralis]MBB3773468.1 allantoin racemase [Ancylobacter tetraedralis]
MISARISPEEARATRLLIVNPNTNPRVTANIRAEIARVILPSTQARVVNPPEGPFSIESEADRDAAEAHVLALLRGSLAARHQAYVLAAFDDIALASARAFLRVPVVGAVEAGITAARTLARRFTVVTTVASALPGIRSQLERYGVAQMATARAAGIGVAQAAEGGGVAIERLLETIARAVKNDGAEAILLGSGGLTGSADRLRPHVHIPIIDAVLAAAKLAEALAALAPRGSSDEPMPA